MSSTSLVISSVSMIDFLFNCLLAKLEEKKKLNDPTFFFNSVSLFNQEMVMLNEQSTVWSIHFL